MYRIIPPNQGTIVIECETPEEAIAFVRCFQEPTRIGGSTEPGALSSLRLLRILQEAQTPMLAKEVSARLGLKHERGLGALMVAIKSRAIRAGITVESVISKSRKQGMRMWAAGPNIGKFIECLMGEKETG